MVKSDLLLASAQKGSKKAKWSPLQIATIFRLGDCVAPIGMGEAESLKYACFFTNNLPGHSYSGR